MLSTTDTDSPKTPDFKTILLTRHAQNETVCVSAYKVVNGKFVVSERFCNGVDEVANLIERSYQREDIGAIWTNIQRLKPGSSRRKKGETIDAYTNMTIDIDRRDKRDADGNKVNATDGEREALRTAAEKIAKFLSPSFGPCVFADSGNGFHLNWKLADIETGEGQRYYRAVLALLKRQFESPEANIEIDASLADDTQVVTVWGTWNRKYPELLDRPQRQSKVLFFPPTQKPIQFYDLEIFLNENKDDSAALASTKPEEKSPRKKIADQKPDPEWLENHGVPHLVEFWAPHIAHEEDSYDRGGDTHHPIAPCPCHGGEDFHHHSHARDCEIIEFADGGIGISCFSGELSLGQVIAKMNAVKGENYPHRVFAEESDEEIARAFGVEDAHAVPTPVGEVCYRENCACGNVHVQRPKPQELFEEGEYELWREGETGITGIRLSDVKERPVEWLWTNRLPAGCGLVVSGAPGTNKSMLSLSLVACVPTGTDWPDGEKNEMGPREVLIAATEDNLETTIKPRLMAMGADMNKITSIKNVFDVGNDGKRKSRDLNLDGDAAKLYRMLKARPDILMVVLDPLTGFFGDVDGNDNRRIRPMMQRIAKVCRLTGVAFVLLIHENKRGDANAVDKILGAGAVAQVVRAGIRISKDPKRKPDGRIMANIKGNLSRDNGGMRFDVKSTNVTAWDGRTLEDIGYIEWGEKHAMSADDVMDEERAAKKAAGEDTKLGQAVKILEEALIGGKRLQRDVHRLLDEAGISDATKRRAKAKVGVVSSKSAPWYWWIGGTEEPESAPEKTMEVAGEEAL
jgi:hypothetical protein